MCIFAASTFARGTGAGAGLTETVGAPGHDMHEQEGARSRPRDPVPEDHWEHVLKKLAPQGYQKSPAWQQEIIGRVVKQMTRRQHSGPTTGLGVSKDLVARTIDLSALGVSPEVADAFRLEEQRVNKTMRELPNPNLVGTRDGLISSSVGAEVSAVEKQLTDRSNQVHYYIRAIQMEQLLAQDLDAELKVMREEVGAAVKDEQFGQAKVASVQLRLERQLAIVLKRCNSLTVKASEIGSDNSNVRLNIDDLRKEKMSHREQVMRMKVKAEKMDADIGFLTHQAHAALDQREKVRGKFLMAQRDMMQEREQKLAVIGELVTRANALDEDWADRQAQIADAEEQRRRKTYGTGRKRREAYESAEVRFGFLTAQSRGWESEFDRLQAFTAMETKFDPREEEGKKVVEEITSRYAEKERANTSLLRYLNEQQAEISTLTEQHKDMQARREELQTMLGMVRSGYGGGLTPESLLAAAAVEDARSQSIETLLDEVCTHVHAASSSVLCGGHSGASLNRVETRCTVKTLERWLAMLERELSDIYSACKTMCQGDDNRRIAIEKPLLVLSDWCLRDKVNKVPKVTVPEIHDALCLQAAQQRRGGELEEEEEDLGEEAKKEAEKNRSPFQRAKVNKAQERQRIIEWARRRQPGQGQAFVAQAQQVEQGSRNGSSSVAPIRASTSAPTLRQQQHPGSGIDINHRGGLPSIIAVKPQNERRQAAERAAAYTAQNGSNLPHASPSNTSLQQQTSGGAEDSVSLPVPAGGRRAAGGKGQVQGRLRAVASASVPGLTATPKDLGTVIYLLGTQSNSMNARRFLEHSGRLD